MGLPPPLVPPFCELCSCYLVDPGPLKEVRAMTPYWRSDTGFFPTPAAGGESSGEPALFAVTGES